jgi:cytochrome c oxidase assembly protein subunit 15
MNSAFRESLLPFWLRCWAVFTICATLVLLFLGSVVTTFKVGMVDPVWPTTPWHLLFISWDEPSPGFLIEHGHRLAGYIVGCCVIVLAVGLWFLEPRAWVRRLGWLALIGVSLQGVLGGMRVRLNVLFGTDLAALHGCFAQLVFSLLAVLALVTSSRWARGTPRLADSHGMRLQRWSIITAILLYAQIVLGAVLRHYTYSPVGQRGHLLFAFVSVAAVAWLIKLALEDPARTAVVPAVVLAALVMLQVLLGVEAWLMRFANGISPEAQAQVQLTIGQAGIRTAHVLTGFGILAVAVVTALRSHRLLAVDASTVANPATGRLEGAA